MITIRLTPTETADLRDRIRLALTEGETTDRGRVAIAQLQALSTQLDAACAGYAIARANPAPVTPLDEMRLN